jgi:hypothetical protein
VVERRRQDVPFSAFRFWKDVAIYGMDSRAWVWSQHKDKVDITHIEAKELRYATGREGL